MRVKLLIVWLKFLALRLAKTSLQIGTQSSYFSRTKSSSSTFKFIQHIRMASQNNFNFPYFPSPPYHPYQPPPPPAAKPPRPPVQPPPLPPHPPVQPPPLPPRPPSPDNDPTVIVIVFISVGGVFFLAFLAAALFCFLKKRKKKTVQETDIIHFNEHKKIKEAIVEGPHGIETVVLSVEDDIHIDEEKQKNEKVGEGLHAKSVEGNIASSGSHQHHIEHKS